MKDFDTFVKNFTDEKFKDVIIYKNSYHFQNKLVKHIPLQPFSPGPLLGTKKKEFKPSVYLLELLSKKSSNKIFVNPKIEWLFLCGRDVFEDSVMKDESTSNTFLVQNERDENLGLGRKIKKGRQTLIKNVLDRGDFLRRER